MPWYHALLLGIVEALTEFLPVSSTGHLLLVNAALGHTEADETACGAVELPDFTDDLITLQRGALCIGFQQASCMSQHHPPCAPLEESTSECVLEFRNLPADRRCRDLEA